MLDASYCVFSIFQFDALMIKNNWIEILSGRLLKRFSKRVADETQSSLLLKSNINRLLVLLFPVFQLIAYASTADGYSADLPLPLPIRVEDENDNHPIFTEAIYNFEVPESSKLGKTIFLNWTFLHVFSFFLLFVFFLLGNVYSFPLFSLSLVFILLLTGFFKIYLKNAFYILRILTCCHTANIFTVYCHFSVFLKLLFEVKKLRTSI